MLFKKKVVDSVIGLKQTVPNPMHNFLHCITIGLIGFYIALKPWFMHYIDAFLLHWSALVLLVVALH